MGDKRKMNKDKWFLNGGRGSERTVRLLCETYENKITSLEKENAELKGLKDVTTLIRANNDTVITLIQLNNMLVSKSQQLTKAKELLKEWLQTSNASGCDNINIVTDTEQFLKD